MEPNQTQNQQVENSTTPIPPIQKFSHKKNAIVIAIVVFILLLIIGVFYYQFTKKNTQNMNIQQKTTEAENLPNNNVAEEPSAEEKQQYIVGINGLNVSVQILVNGVSAFSEKLEASVSIPMYILTPFIKNGDNTVEIKVTSISNEYGNNSCNFKFGHVDDVDVSTDIVYDKTFVCGEALKNKGVENFIYQIIK